MIKHALFIIIVLSLLGCDQSESNFLESEDAYFGIRPPGLNPKIFAPGIVSKSKWREHSQITFSPNGDEIYWSALEKGKRERIYCSKYENGFWTRPSVLNVLKNDSVHLYGSPILSPDGNKLFFYSKDRPGGIGHIDAWYVERKNNDWNQPINAGEPYNTKGDERPPILTDKGHAYAMGSNYIENKFDFNIFNYENGIFSQPRTVNINSKTQYWWPFYISPNETYIIFPSPMKGGYGGLDLYVCFKNEDDKWGEAINLGAKINTEKWERFPTVSPDGKYLLFMRHTENWDIYWVSMKQIMSLKNSQ